VASPVRVVVAAAVAAGAAACGDVDAREAEIADLRAQLAQHVGAQAALEDRFDELDGAIERLASDRRADQTAVHVATMDEDLSRVIDALTVIEATLDAEVDDRDAFEEEASTAAADLRRSVTTLQGSVDEVKGELEELQTLYATLRDRLDRLQRGR